MPPFQPVECLSFSNKQYDINLHENSKKLTNGTMCKVLERELWAVFPQISSASLKI